MVGRGAARRRPDRPGHGVPAGDRARRGLGHRPDAASRHRDLGRGPGHEQHVARARQAQPLPGPRLLVAQHQHLPRPALGPRAGDLRRGPVPHGRHRHRVREGHAGPGPAVPEDGRDRQALRGAQRAGVAPAHLRRASERDRPARDLPPGLPGPGREREGGVGDVLLQLLPRAAGLRQRRAARQGAARRVGLRRLRRLRLRGGHRHPREPQGPEDRGRGRRHGAPRRDRPRVRLRLLGARLTRLLPGARRRGGAGAGEGERPRPCPAPALPRAGEARRLRPPAEAAVGGLHLRVGRRLAEAPAARPRGGSQVDRPAEERERHAAPEEGPGPRRRHRAERRRGGGAGRQLQRHADRPGDRPGRGPRRGGRGDEGDLRPRRPPRHGAPRPARRARLGALDG